MHDKTDWDNLQLAEGKDERSERQEASSESDTSKSVGRQLSGFPEEETWQEGPRWPLKPLRCVDTGIQAA